jgi:hypothetical protein
MRGAPSEERRPLLALFRNQVGRVLSIDALDFSDQPLRVRGEERMSGGATMPVATIAEIAFTPMHDSMPVGASRTLDPLANDVTAL